MIWRVPPLDGLNGVVHCGVDQRHVDKSMTTWTLTRDELQRDVVPVGNRIGMR